MFWYRLDLDLGVKVSLEIQQFEYSNRAVTSRYSDYSRFIGNNAMCKQGRLIAERGVKVAEL